MAHVFSNEMGVLALGRAYTKTHRRFTTEVRRRGAQAQSAFIRSGGDRRGELS